MKLNKSPWRNWLARLTVNQEVGSSSLPGDVSFLSIETNNLFFFGSDPTQPTVGRGGTGSLLNLYDTKTP